MHLRKYEENYNLFEFFFLRLTTLSFLLKSCLEDITKIQVIFLSFKIVCINFSAIMLIFL
jgi:hypothetical protein